MSNKLTLQLQALHDLLGRYGRAWRHAWARRAELSPPERLPHEAQFLPAALALQDTPPPAAPRWTLRLLVALVVLALLWSVLGHVDVVATAQGKIVPNDRTKTIQPLETATVRRIAVSDGQEVKAGQVLLELDATLAQADKERLQGEWEAATLQVARARALLRALDGTPQAAQAAQMPFDHPEGVDRQRWQQARQLLAGQVAEHAARQRQLQAEVTRRQAELRSTQELVRKLEQTVPIAQQRARDFERLVAQDYVSRHGYLEREQVRLEQEADLATQRSRLQEIGAALEEARAQLASLDAETRRAALADISDGQQKADALEQELRKADSREKLTTLTSPVDGTVQQLAVHTVGGVVTAAQPLMIVVPRDHPLEVEAFLENKDIGFVKAGQEAEVKVETFPYTKYGTLPATVTLVSHDAIPDERRGLIYAVRVKMAHGSMWVDGAEVPLTPGMAVTAEVKTGRRRLIEFFLTPLLQHSSESLRER